MGDNSHRCRPSDRNHMIRINSGSEILQSGFHFNKSQAHENWLAKPLTSAFLAKSWLLARIRSNSDITSTCHTAQTTVGFAEIHGKIADLPLNLCSITIICAKSFVRTFSFRKADRVRNSSKNGSQAKIGSLFNTFDIKIVWSNRFSCSPYFRTGHLFCVLDHGPCKHSMCIARLFLHNFSFLSKQNMTVRKSIRYKFDARVYVCCAHILFRQLIEIERTYIELSLYIER